MNGEFDFLPRFKPPIPWPPWDPLPPWLKLDEDRLRRIMVVRIDAQIGNLKQEIQQLEQIKEIMG